MKRRLLLLAILSWHGPALAELEDYLTQRWYWTEVIVFQRAPILEFNTQEQLATRAIPPVPHGLRAFRNADGGISAPYEIDPATRTMLVEPPYRGWSELTVSQAAAARTADADRDASLTGTLSTASGTSPQQSAARDEPALLAALLKAVADYEESLFEQSYLWEAEPSGLAAEAQTLQRTQGYQVLLHGRWLQPVPERTEPAPLLIQTGRPLPGGWQLQGSLGMTVGRYLHFHARLWYREPNLGRALLDLPLLPGAALPVSLPFALDETPAYMVLDEQRRMRSQETHHLDHPKLGVLVRAEPVAPPAELVRLYEALQERQQ